jgi:ABC-2 type transport system permease protein
MNAYATIVAARFRTLLRYRGAALGGLFTQTAFGLMRIMILEGFYRSARSAQSFTFEQAVAYVWLGQATFVMFPWNVDPEIRDLVRSGGVAYELCRPLDLYNLWYARAVAFRAAPTLLRLVPMFLVAAIGLPLIGLDEWRLRLPPSPGIALLWLVAMLVAFVLSCAIGTLLNITLLWTVSGQGTVGLLAALTTFLGGMTVPLPYFPAWSQPFLRASPFAGLMDLPARVYTGAISTVDATWMLAFALGWTAATMALGRWLLARRMRHVIVQGG